ncbi:PEP-CTERM sorting domain-containing protein [Crocosphaera sp. XPORK-15E]|uniref:PEP-CTERM sorting domain-containing protein n=1 Tax=Crocosphaera sp. XPORK-15E TaxID=3110247 RepID=UPI002B2191DD|nr:PEP-CTERM sorting domain-containing protein [Crocosphaera sp. XPORK-15E]MEA5534092.1 PEP-CTERM sorting domain-containing protein [Crocosphaera sp. XPORK-15E]
MLNANKLTQTSLVIGVSALASLVSSIAIAPSAQAATFQGRVNPGGLSLDDLGTVPVEMITSVMLDRVIYDNFNFEAVFVGDSVLISDAGGGQSFLRLSPDGGQGMRDGQYSYDVATKSFDGIFDVFTAVELDSDVVGIGTEYSVIKAVNPNNGLPENLSSIDGDPDGLGYAESLNVTKIKITDILSSNSDTLLSVNNAFTQVPGQEERSVPEPGTVLGLLVMGGLGLVAKRKKQK